jgi:hypothetical protein
MLVENTECKKDSEEITTMTYEERDISKEISKFITNTESPLKVYAFLIYSVWDNSDMENPTNIDLDGEKYIFTWKNQNLVITIDSVYDSAFATIVHKDSNSHEKESTYKYILTDSLELVSVIDIMRRYLTIE